MGSKNRILGNYLDFNIYFIYLFSEIKSKNCDMSGMGGFKFPGGGTGGAPPPSSGNAKVSNLNFKRVNRSV